MTTPSGAASHEVFRQAMMQRLHEQSQQLSTALGNFSTTGSAQTVCTTPSHAAARRQKHIQRDAVAEHVSERISSPARSALGTLPEGPTAASSADAASHAGSRRPSTAEGTRLWSSLQPCKCDASLPGSALNASMNAAGQECTGMLPGLEGELDKLLGPDKAAAGSSVSSPRLQSTPAAAAAAGQGSESRSFNNKRSSLARMHSNPLYREDTDTATVAGPQVLQALENGSNGDAQREDGHVVGTMGQLPTTSGRLVSLPRGQELQEQSLHMLAASMLPMHKSV